ncbi:hypothetical protein HOY80DRAFT_946195 [Tuber brumale]|nr:hypothetical protein HOY80DRAFT_946195 [Tuber brumale]
MIYHSFSLLPSSLTGWFTIIRGDEIGVLHVTCLGSGERWYNTIFLTRAVKPPFQLPIVTRRILKSRISRYRQSVRGHPYHDA